MSHPQTEAHTIALWNNKRSESMRSHETTEEFDDSLRVSEERYRTLVEESLDAILLLAADGTILEANNAAAQLFGFANRNETLGRNLNRECCVQPQQRDLIGQAMRRQGFIRNFEYEIRQTDGHKRRVLEHATAIHDANGQIVGSRSTLRDITEWKQLEQQLFQAQKMESISALIGGIGHDFVNVLNNLRGFTSQLKKYAHESAKVLKYTETIEKSTERGIGLASQLLSFIKPKKRTAATANVAEVIAEIVELMRETFPKNIVVTTSVRECLLPVNVDSGDLYQAFLNLCLNARDAMPNGGTLTIEVDATTLEHDSVMQKYILVTVADTGRGIPLGIRDRIFDPFFSTKQSGKGSGLGLSIVYNIIKNNKGVVDVESEEGRGTTFSLYFPCSSSDGSTLSSPQDANRTGNELILLADDEQTMQELGKELLQEQGYRVIVARDGVEAVDLYRQHASDVSLVVLDLLMPRLDGGQTYLELKKINPNVRAFFCTGFTPGDVIGSLLESESLVALQKPFHPDEFVRTVRDVMVAH